MGLYHTIRGVWSWGEDYIRFAFVFCLLIWLCGCDEVVGCMEVSGVVAHPYLTRSEYTSCAYAHL